MEPANTGAVETLPDLLSPGLRIVFVGINPSIYSARHGHYFARPTNRFWPAFSRSRLSAAARARLGVTELEPEHDGSLLDDGFGFTDVVKVPSASASTLDSAAFAHWAPRARDLIEHFEPALACFQGTTALRPFLRYALGVDAARLAFGLQPVSIGATRIFLVPNPSPANARFRLDDLVKWFDALAEEEV